MKNLKSLLFLGLTVLVLAGCGSTATNDAETASSMPEVSSVRESLNPGMGSEATDSSMTAGEMRVFTLEELSQYNGKDGNPAYVAVDGVVYDVSDVEAWPDGEHKNGITAGNELSDEILNSPHGKQVLENLPVVGTLAEE